MPANTSPIFTLTPNLGAFAVLNTANALTVSDGTGTIGTTMKLALAAGTFGSFVGTIRFMPCQTAAGAGTNTAATVFRIYESSQTAGATTNADTHLIAEVVVGIQSAGNSTTACFPVEVPLNFTLDPSHTILVSQHAVCAANTEWHVTCPGSGDY